MRSRRTRSAHAHRRSDELLEELRVVERMWMELID
jgi:hypothetical protein